MTINEMVSIRDWEELTSNIHLLPTIVVADIDKRVTDWLASGGSLEDGYIGQQLRYAENVINAERKRK